MVVADRDDDDVDGIADGAASVVASRAQSDATPLDARYVGATLTPASGIASGVGSARLLVQGRPLAWGERIPAGARLQGVTPGRLRLTARAGDRTWPVVVDVYGFEFRDGENRTLDVARERASLTRTPPTRENLAEPEAPFEDVDALRIVVASPQEAPFGSVSVHSVTEDGARLDALRDVSLLPVSCGAGLSCVASAPLRFVVDEVDRWHPLVSSRSVRAEVGGAVAVVDRDGRKLQAIRVEGPRATAAGAIARHKLFVRPIVLRTSSGGGPAVGGTDAGAVEILRQELALASATWGQCGITFGPLEEQSIALVDPPPPYLVAFGDDTGLAASGGEISFRVSGTPLTVVTKKGWSTHQAALELVRVATAKGFRATLSPNARIEAGAAPSVDVLLKTKAGKPAHVTLVASSDPTLGVAVGAVELDDGLHHFRDTDAAAGTLEERALVKAVEDGDPRTVEVIVVPYFAGGGRIGESFIGSDGSSLRNVVILDRAGVRARRTSSTLAHELGHVILDEPGHPDDFGTDTPTLLMDSDASDASPFGPRRLTLDECARALRQSGPSANVPLLSPWKLRPIDFDKRK